MRASRIACRGPTSCPTASTPCCAWSISCSTKAISRRRARSLTRVDLSGEAIRLGRLLVAMLPEPEAIGLLALMLLQESRRAARATAGGELILLADQDRSLWNRAQIDRGIDARCARARGAARRLVRAAGSDRGRACRGRDGRGDRLAPHRRAVRPAVAGRPVAGGRVEPRSRRRNARRRRRPARHSSTISSCAATSTTTGSSMRRARTCAGAWDARPTPARPISARSTSRARRRSGDSWSAGSRSCRTEAACCRNPAAAMSNPVALID